MFKVISRLLLSGACLFVAFVLMLLAKYSDGWVFDFYSDASRKVMGILATVTSPIPVALWEVGLVTLLLWMIYTMIRSLWPFRLHIWISGVILSVSFGVLIFVCLWGLNYFAPSMASQMHLPERQYTVEELKEATMYYRDMASLWAPEVQRDENGAMIAYDFSDLAERANEGYAALAKEFPFMKGVSASVKPLFFSGLYTKTGTIGLFAPFTGESTVSTVTHPTDVPFTMCHEIGHRLALAREDEANFAGFLACIRNEAPEFRYSGYYKAFIYCYNALYKVDPNAAFALWPAADSYVSIDTGRSSQHYEENKSDTLTSVTDKVHDSYLQGFGVENGTQSYGEVADLLLAWYFERIA